jgi:CBS domain-containing protein/uncharacterized protein (DUF2267 family)
MNLQRYCHRRLIVLTPRATALEAARAMTEQHVGTVLVADRAGSLAVLTDRDLVAVVLSAGIDPRRVELGQIVTRSARVVDLRRDSLDDAIAIMQDVPCRRVPILEDGKLVGLVTLDDLLRDGAIGPARVTDIVSAQVEPPGPSRRSTRTSRASRHAAHAERALATMLEAVGQRTGIEARPRREVALEIVLRGLCRRIRPGEARDFVAQLPSALQSSLLEQLDGPKRWITRGSIEDELCDALRVDRAAAAAIVDGVADAVADCVAPGAVEGVVEQLPWAMKNIFGAQHARGQEVYDELAVP